MIIFWILIEAASSPLLHFVAQALWAQLVPYFLGYAILLFWQAHHLVSQYVDNLQGEPLMVIPDGKHKEKNESRNENGSCLGGGCRGFWPNKHGYV